MLTIVLIALVIDVIILSLIPDKYHKKYAKPHQSHRRWFSSSSSSGKRPYGLPWMGGTLNKKDRYI